MAELRFGYGKDMDKYKTESRDNENFDIEIRIENGDIIEVNTRNNNKRDGSNGGYAIRLKRKNRDKITLRDINY